MTNYTIIGGDQKQYGPVAEEQLRRWIREGRVILQSQVKADGDAGWRPVSQIPELASMFSGRGAGSALLAAPSSKAILRILILAEVLAFILSCVLSSVLQSTLPETLRAYDAASTEKSSQIFAVVYVCLAAPVLVVALVSHIGLFFFWRPARVLYLAGGIGILVMVVLDGPAVRTGLEGTFDYLSAAIYGSVLSLIYFSPFRDLYAEKQSNTALDPTPTAP